MSARGEWVRVSRMKPCPICGRPDWCMTARDGSAAICARTESAKRAGEAGWLHKLGVSPTTWRSPVRRAVVPSARQPERADFAALAERFRAALPVERRDELARTLGVTPAALDTLGAGWATADDLRAMHASGAGWTEVFPGGAFVFPERDGGGRIIGLSLRAIDGRKGSPAGKLGARRGLIVSATLRERPDPVLVAEGASDCAACEVLGLACVGRPSNVGGAEHAARMLRGREVLIVGENDAKESGAWPGRDGAEAVARRLAGEWDEPVNWTFPPARAKDIRAWLQARVATGLDVADAAACEAAGAELLAELQAAAREAKAERVSQAERLVRLAHELFRIGLAEGDEAFAVPHSGPNVAMMFRGSRDALRSALAREYRRRTSKTPSASALADAMTALQGDALECTPEPVFLRVAEHAGAIVLDLGDASGRCAIIRPGAWELADVSPVLFRRTALTAPMPEPERGGDVAELRALLNVTDDSWPLLLGFLVAAFLPNIPHPVLMLGGEQGTGKSTAARLLLGLIDASTAPLRSQPADMEQWALAAAGSWAVCIDNVSGLPSWFSDALCKAVTGDGWVRRRLYTDCELSVVAFRRVVTLTAIDAGALRGDLADRLLIAELERIGDSARREDAALAAAYEAARPRLLRGAAFPCRGRAGRAAARRARSDAAHGRLRARARGTG